MSPRTIERRRVVGGEVAAGDYLELPNADTLWLVAGVAPGTIVEVTLRGYKGAPWSHYLGQHERVHVWRAPAVGR